MSVLLWSAQSLDYLLVPVVATDENGVLVNPTADVVSVAFVAEGTALSGSTTYTPAVWETNNSDPTAPIYSARVLVGPTGDYVPTAGMRVDVWVSVTDNPESPKIHSGVVRFT